MTGLIKALRASRGDDARVIQQALADIANEVKSSDWELKAGAVLKLTYLEMLGHAHLAQHAFPVIECMSSQKPHIKQIGYLAASQSFMQGTDVILLANNLIKKVSPSFPCKVKCIEKITKNLLMYQGPIQ